MSKLFPNISNQMISDAQSDDEKELDYIIKSYIKSVEAIAKSYINSPVETEDLIQEGMIGLLAAVKSYNSTKGASFKTYATRCIENSIQNAIGKNTRKKDIPNNNLVEYLEDELTVQNSVRSAEDDFIAQENVLRLTEILDERLSQFENEVLRLHIVGCNYNEIAKRLDKTPKAIDNALQRVRNKLSKFFTDFK